MRDNGCRADVKDSTDIPHPRAVHGHINDAFMSTWLVAIFYDTLRLLTLDTGNLNNCHTTLRTKGQEHTR